MNGYAPQQPPQPTASPGGKPRLGGPPPGVRGPATPQQNPANAYPGSPHVPRPTPPPNPNTQIAPDFQYTAQQIELIGNQLSEYEPDKLPPHLKRQGDDWHAVFNPNVRRRLDVDLVHNLAHQSVVCCVRFSQDGRFVATGCNRSAQIFDVNTGKQVCHLQDNSTSSEGDLYIRSVCFSPDGRFLATGAEDKIIRVWDIAAKQIRHQFAGHDQDIYSLDFASDGRYIASGSGDRTIRLWDLHDNQCVLTMSIEDGVTTVAMSPNGRYVAAGSLDKSVRIWDTSTGVLVERTEGEQGHKDSVYSVAFSPGGEHLVSGSLDKTIRMWRLNPQGRNYPGMGGGNCKSGECIRVFEGHKDFVLSVALTPDGGWVMSGSKDRGVQFWDPESGQAQLMLQGHKNSGKFPHTYASQVSLLISFSFSHLCRASSHRQSLRNRVRRHESPHLALRELHRSKWALRGLCQDGTSMVFLIYHHMSSPSCVSVCCAQRGVGCGVVTVRPPRVQYGMNGLWVF